ncbi:hypothetical protein GGF32_005189 [Allomyces javanicus]|nr:hypothetical protein GGF32_005189 [Allomyces javanicus]
MPWHAVLDGHAPSPPPELVKKMVKFVGKLSGGNAHHLTRHPRWMGQLNDVFKDMCTPRNVSVDKMHHVLTFWVPRYDGCVMIFSAFEPFDPSDALPSDKHPPQRDVYIGLHTPQNHQFLILVQAMRARNIAGDLDMVGCSVPGRSIQYAVLTVSSSNTGNVMELDQRDAFPVLKLDDAKAVFADPARLAAELETMLKRSADGSL